MKTTLFSILVVLLAIFTVATNTFAQDYTTLGLPEGAKARLGKGKINEVKYSTDGTRLAVASSIGIWIYDAQTGEELELIRGHTSGVNSVSFSPDGTTIASGVKTVTSVSGMRPQAIPSTRSPGIRLESTAYRLVRMGR